MSEDDFKPLSAARVAVLGLGLMGGSLALALRGRCGEVTGHDINHATAASALALGAIDRAVSLDEALRADLVVLAAPPRVILAQLADLSRRPPPAQPTVLLDLGSTKGAITAAMAALPPGWHPLGGHPMCGKEVSGLAQAEAELFRDKLFILTPLPRAAPGAWRLAEALVQALGARLLLLPPDRHDTVVALASHLPYAVAALLVRVALASPDPALWAVASSGFRDTSRLAASDLTMMVDILLTNRAAVRQALADYRAELDTLAGLVAQGDEDALRAFLEPPQQRRRLLFPPAE
ncbi:MAG: prephenate dehydrogenase/arogenate dehydrogenase family protein [Anaerolineales bacterium]|nr:prephenate dehydrogenase/arogenate dehydrogenase family protein [Anaerolineales bacterium]